MGQVPKGRKHTNRRRQEGDPGGCRERWSQVAGAPYRARSADLL